MKKLLVVILVWMLCIGMTGFATSLTITSKPKDTVVGSPVIKAVEKTTIGAMENLKKSVYNYLNMDENIYGSQEQVQSSIDAPWIMQTSNIFEWWVRLKYNGETFQEQLDVSINDFQKKFLRHPYYSEDVFFNVDGDPEDDIKVSFGFYWESILNKKTNENYISLENMLKVRQINNGPSDLYAGLEVWSEIHINWGLVVDSSVEGDVSSQSSQIPGSQQQMIPQSIKFASIIKQLMQWGIGQKSNVGFGLLQTPIGGALLNSQRNNVQSQPMQDPEPLPADNDYFAVGVGYRTAQGDRIPQYVEKRFAFAKDSLFSPVIFQQVMKTEPSGMDPLELLYGFRAWNGSTNEPKYDIAFSVGFAPFVDMTTQFIPLGGFIYYYFDADSQYNNEIKITYASDINVGGGDGTSLSLVFNKIDNNMSQTGRWMSFGLRRDPHGFDYEANAIFNVAVIVDSPWFSQKVRVNGLPMLLSYEWKIFDDFEVIFVQGEMFYVNVRGYADLTMSSPIGEVLVYYPKLRDPTAPDVTFLKVQNIPSSRRLEASATLNIQNGSMLRIDANGYVDLTKSGSLGDINVYYPKADPENDPDIVLMKVPAGSINSQRVSAEATLYVDVDDFNNTNNYVYGKIQRQADSNFNEMDLYLPGVVTPLVQVTDIPANAYATGTFWWSQLKGFGRAERSSASQNPDPVHFNLEFDTLTLSDVFSIGDGHVQTDFKIAEDGYFKFDTAHDILGNQFSVGNSATGNSFAIGASTVSAQDFEAAWGLNTSGPELQVDSLALTGTLDALNDFDVAIALDGEIVDFTGDWSLGDSGGFSVDLQQNADVRIDLINLDNASGLFDLNGYVILSSNLHYDMSWKWKKGSSLEDPGYFKINEGTNEANLKEIGLYFTYKDGSSIDRWGVDATLTNFALYICVEWYYQDGFHIWPVIEVSGQLDMNLLLNYNWYEIC